ncbi:LOG family protein [Ramlibacter alkalitolerans]|uniref:Cytokinin riboside 5'-monophosphate phosphoribohydrolase n=1 Tax=Ramlibacter alkalitolerans TaxID=2039631 RepID=A0ABS1JKA4_9BURK|nr:TIGR00730 family Rossman fold protein [Ramlibacter alkalitolerans]MBL0424662.1 TIGR00730 family Rossman fold protein [Ramlibacter alkalitolerans]
MNPAFSLCVYCGSRTGADPGFATAAAAVGRWIGRQGGQLVYGGGNNGLMGVMANAALEAGARVVGVIPRSMVEREWAKQDCTELHIVDNMHQRKSLMAERADAFLAMPGGIGTFEEFFEAWTWKQLGFHRKPVGLFDLGGYYQPLLQFLQQSVDSGFMSEWQMELLTIGDDLEALLEKLVEAARSSPGGVDTAEI